VYPFSKISRPSNPHAAPIVINVSDFNPPNRFVVGHLILHPLFKASILSS